MNICIVGCGQVLWYHFSYWLRLPFSTIHFVDTLINNQLPPLTVTEANKSMKIVHAAYISWEHDGKQALYGGSYDRLGYHLS